MQDIIYDDVVIDTWTKCLNNHVILENINGVIVISSNILHNGVPFSDTKLNDTNVDDYTKVTTKTAIIISKCKNLHILVYNKVSHILVESSKNVNIKVMSGAISGIDILHCHYVNMIINNVPYINMNDCSHCNMYNDTHINKTKTRVNSCVNIFFWRLDIYTNKYSICNSCTIGDNLFNPTRNFDF